MNARIVKGMAAVAMVTALGVGATLGLVGSPFGSGNGGGSGGSSCGEDDSCAAVSYEATASSGSGFTCNATLASCVDLGPGTANFIGTDGSGRIRLGDDTHSPEVWIGDGSTKLQPGNVQIQNGALFLNGTTYLQNLSGAVIVDDANGLVVNSTSAITGMLVVAVTINLGSVVGGCDDVTATVAGVEASDAVFVTPNFNLNAADIFIGNARVTNAGTDEVTFRVCDIGGGGEDPDSGSFLFWVVRKA
jgi:hypothetical protein